MLIDAWRRKVPYYWFLIILFVPFGALICYLTIESGSILPAILLHVLQAVSCELFCIYRNPEMKFHLQK
jgi:membrane protease YdiL (CAAX protease family)